MSTEKPTDADYSRDLRADLAIAEAATKGPWLAGFHPYESTVVSVADRLCEIAEMPELDDRPEDFAAIASNRMAAPAAMRRAIEAEEAILAWSRAVSDPRAPWQDGGDYADRVDEACERLEGVAERIQAARKGDETP